MSIFQTNISLLNKFLKQFTSCFTKKQMAMFTLLIYALFKDYKRNSLDAMAKATHSCNIVDHSKGKRSVMSVLALFSSHHRSIFPLT